MLVLFGPYVAYRRSIVCIRVYHLDARPADEAGKTVSDIHEPRLGSVRIGDRRQQLLSTTARVPIAGGAPRVVRQAGEQMDVGVGLEGNAAAIVSGQILRG